MRRAAVLSVVLLLAATGTAAAAFAADVSFSESFDSLERANETNNVTARNGELRPPEETLNWDIDNETLINATDVPDVGGLPGNVEWGRNGTRLYILSDNEIYQFNVGDKYNASDATFALSTALSGDYSGLEFSPQGQYLFTVDNSTDPATFERYSMSTNWRIAPISLDADRDIESLNGITDVQASPAGHIWTMGDRTVAYSYSANESVQWYPNTLRSVNLGVDAESLEWRGNNTYLNFSGVGSGDTVEIGQSPSLDISDDLTVAMRAHVAGDLDDGNDGGDNDWRIAVGRLGPAGVLSLEIREDHNIRFVVQKGGNNQMLEGCNWEVGKPFSVVATHDASAGESRIYLNGTQCAEDLNQATGPLDTNSQPVQISRSLTERTMLGAIDDVVYAGDHASQQQVDDYHAGNISVFEDARIEMNFSGAIGNTADDATANENDGDITNPDWESGVYGPAGDVLIAQKQNRTMTEFRATDYQLETAVQVDSDNSPELVNESLNGLAWDPDGNQFATMDIHRGDLAIEVYNGGFEPNPSAVYVYDVGGPVRAANLKWEIVNESSGDVDMFVGVRNGPDGSQRLTRVGVNGVDQEDVWQATSAEWTHVVVRVEPEWDGESRWPPSIDQFQVGVDLAEDVRDGIALATVVFVLALLAILVAGALSLRSALFAALSGVGTLLVALWAAGVLATATTVLLLGLLLAGGTLTVVLAWEVI